MIWFLWIHNNNTWFPKVFCSSGNPCDDKCTKRGPQDISKIHRLFRIYNLLHKIKSHDQTKPNHVPKLSKIIPNSPHCNMVMTTTIIQNIPKIYLTASPVEIRILCISKHFHLRYQILTDWANNRTIHTEIHSLIHNSYQNNFMEEIHYFRQMKTPSMYHEMRVTCFVLWNIFKRAA